MQPKRPKRTTEEKLVEALYRNIPEMTCAPGVIVEALQARGYPPLCRVLSAEEKARAVDPESGMDTSRMAYYHRDGICRN